MRGEVKERARVIAMQFLGVVFAGVRQNYQTSPAYLFSRTRS